MFHAGFKNGGKPRKQRPTFERTVFANVAELAGNSNQPRQPSLEEMAAAYWQQQQGNIAAVSPAGVAQPADFTSFFPSLN